MADGDAHLANAGSRASPTRVDMAFAAAATERSAGKAISLWRAGEKRKETRQNLASGRPPVSDCPLGGFSGAEKVSNLPSKGSPSLVSD
jgi:hypothetical protein